MRIGQRHLQRSVAIGLAIPSLLLVLAACSMVRSDHLGEIGSTGAECTSAVGSYFLPKTLLRIQVERGVDFDDPGANRNIDKFKSLADATQIKVHRLRVPDKRFGYCLDYLNLPTSEDLVQVKKYADNHLLGVVTSNAVDQTRVVLNKLILAVFTLISGNPNYQITPQAEARSLFDPTNKSVKLINVFHYELDPFDPLDSARMNAGLNDLGYCLILDHYTFDVSHETIDGYCDNPEQSLRRHPRKAPSYDDGYDKDHKAGRDLAHKADHVHARSLDYAQIQHSVRGLYYRPRIAYNYFLFIKKNRQVRGGWRLAATAPVFMENIAPIISVGLDRALFTQRKTSLLFDEGTLEAACIFKRSELQQAVSVPLTLVKAVTALPANIVQVRIDQTLGKAELRKAEAQLIQTQRQNIAFEREIQKAIAENRPATELKDIRPGAGDHTHQTPATGAAPVKRKDADALSSAAGKPFANLTSVDPGGDLLATWNAVCGGPVSALQQAGISAPPVTSTVILTPQ